jgi:hypothetical protein
LLDGRLALLKLAEHTAKLPSAKSRVLPAILAKTLKSKLSRDIQKTSNVSRHWLPLL